jgi:hypothetical protein
MQYFKHFGTMRHDIKIKRVISKYGLEGYGLYNLTLESITESLSTDSPLPDLQETCEDIAEFYNGNTAKINEIMNFMINQGLFDLDEITGRIMCNKLYKFLDTSQTRSVELRAMITGYKAALKQPNELIEDKSQTVSDGHRQSNTSHDKSERIRRRKEEEKEIEKEFNQFWESYKKKQKRKDCEKKYHILYSKNKLPKIIEHINIIESWHKTDKWKDGYQPDPLTWLNGERWNDEIPQPEKPKEEPKPLDGIAAYNRLKEKYG